MERIGNKSERTKEKEMGDREGYQRRRTHGHSERHGDKKGSKR